MITTMLLYRCLVWLELSTVKVYMMDNILVQQANVRRVLMTTTLPSCG